MILKEIIDFKNEFRGNKELLNRALYPNNFESSFTNLDKKIAYTNKKPLTKRDGPARGYEFEKSRRAQIILNHGQLNTWLCLHRYRKCLHYPGTSHPSLLPLVLSDMLVGQGSSEREMAEAS